MAKFNLYDLADVYRERLGHVGLPYPLFAAQNGYRPGNGTSLPGRLAERGNTAPPQPYEVGGAVSTTQAGGFGQFSQATPALSSEEVASYLGLPMLMPMWLDGWLLPVEPLVRIQGGKTIVETPVSGLDGTIKELISANDWQVSIAGLLISDDDEALPQTDLRRLKDIILAKRSVEVKQEILNLFGIHQLVIKSYEFPEMEGQPSQQFYSLDCVSDRLYQLELGADGMYQINAAQ